MPGRLLISRELAELFGILSHPDRIRLIEELGVGEVDVNGLQQALGLPHSRVSQHLSVLRAHRVVAERRAGRHVYYHLLQPELAAWVLLGADFVRSSGPGIAEFRSALRNARLAWSRDQGGQRQGAHR